MQLKRNRTYHGMEAAGMRESRGRRAMKDNGGMGMDEIILVLSVLIVVTLIFREKIAMVIERLFAAVR